MPALIINAGPFRFTARLETDKAPLTCAAFLKLLPLKEHLLHVRWSGESTWVPLGELAGNHFLAIVSGAENLAELGRLTLWKGAQPILIDVLKA